MTQQPMQQRQYPRPVRVLMIVSGAFSLLALIVGLIQHSDGSGASCGSPLIPRDLSPARVVPCEWALSSGNTWMWVLFTLAGLGLLTALVAALSSDTQR